MTRDPLDALEDVYDATDAPRLLCTRLADVTPERVSWLWPGRLPGGKLVIVEGDPGLGKSTLAMDLAARVTTGALWPDQTANAPRGSVVILSAEDGAADTIRPRFDVAGGDAEQAEIITGVLDGEEGLEGTVSFPEHVVALRAVVRRSGARLVVVDPLAAYLSGAVNAHRDHDVRRALAPLSALASETGCVVLVVRHLNKGTGPAIYRGGGSIGISGAARAVLVVAADPNDQDRRVLAAVKSNLAPLPDSLTFALEDVSGVARISWGAASPLTAGQLLAAQVQDEEQRSALDEAKDFLLEILSAGPVQVRQVEREARDAGIAKRTLERARAALRCRSSPDGLGGPRLLSLPSEEQSPPRNPSGRHSNGVAQTAGDGGDWRGPSADEDGSRPLEEDLLEVIDRGSGDG